MDITRKILSELNFSLDQYDSESENEYTSKLMQLLSVLEKSGHFEGINRKIQLKPIGWAEEINPQTGAKIIKVIEALFIMKWGGELTHTGNEQSMELGRYFRNHIYPIENEGVLRLHNTYRHDMKIYSSDEGRCQLTAAAFTKGFLELEGELTPILVGLVRKDAVTQDLLDFSKVGETSPKNVMIRECLKKVLNCDHILYDSIKTLIGENNIDANMKNTLMEIGNPLQLLKRVIIFE